MGASDTGRPGWAGTRGRRGFVSPTRVSGDPHWLWLQLARNRLDKEKSAEAYGRYSALVSYESKMDDGHACRPKSSSLS